MAKTPICKKELQSFLGLTNYYRKFLKDYAKITACLFDLIKADATFEWGPEQQQQLEMLKIMLMRDPKLAYPQDDGMFVLDTDASNDSIGAVLSQDQDGSVRVVAYASKRLGPGQ